jgi:hypothetical protein
MKTKHTLVIAILAIATLSFSFVSSKKQKVEEPSVRASQVETVGGFALEDEL